MKLLRNKQKITEPTIKYRCGGPCPSTVPLDTSLLVIKVKLNSDNNYLLFIRQKQTKGTEKIISYNIAL
jgi:hypothetical protein